MYLSFFILTCPEAKNALPFETMSAAFMSFYDIDIEKIPKRPLSIDFTCFSDSLSCRNTSSSFQSRSHLDSFHSW